jgi:hypothetical protein
MTKVTKHAGATHIQLQLRQEARIVHALRIVHQGVHVFMEQAEGVGYVLKTQAAVDLVQAIREVLQGAIYLSPKVARAVVQAYLTKADRPPDPLTSREREILRGTRLFSWSCRRTRRQWACRPEPAGPRGD